MSSEILCRIGEPINLQRAWSAVLSNDEEDGRLAPSVERFASLAHQLLPELSSALIDRTYRPEPFRSVRIGDPDGGGRELHLSLVADRVVERAVAQVLGHHIDPVLSPWSFAFRPGMGVREAIRAITDCRDSGSVWVVRSDVKSCFDSIDRERLLRDVEKVIDCEHVAGLVRLLVSRPVREGGRLLETSRGVPQGSPLSPLLANLFLDRLDRGMAERGYIVVRYADDLTLGCESREHADECLAELRKVCTGMNLALNEEKTAIMSFDEGFAFLGEELSLHYPPPHREADEAPRRRSVYVCSDGGLVRIEDGQLVVSRGDEDLLEVPQSLVGSLALYGSTSLSSGARTFALRENIPVVFLSRRGTYSGVLTPGRRPSPRLIRAQVTTTDDESFSLSLVRSIIRGKLANARALLLRYGHRSKSDRAIKAAQKCLELREQVVSAQSVDIARGLEGAGAAAYWSGFGSLVSDPFAFGGRQARPSRDPVNSALSFGYAVLLGEVVGALHSAGLDPSFGYLHTDQDNRPSLALDLMEEFRPLIVDTTVLSLLRHNGLSDSSFRYDDGACLLTESGRRKLIGAYEDRMLTVFAHVPSGKRVSYRRALLLQAWQVSAAISSGIVRYEPVSWR
jgi:CRISP-associated protein Cas1